MDPFTHAIIGLGTAALSGQPIALTNPIYIGAALGAIAPDIDVATRGQSRFLHTVTVIISDELKVMASYLHPFGQDAFYPVEGGLLPAAAKFLQGDA